MTDWPLLHGPLLAPVEWHNPVFEGCQHVEWSRAGMAFTSRPPGECTDCDRVALRVTTAADAARRVLAATF